MPKDADVKASLGAFLTEDRFGNVNNAYDFDGVDYYIIAEDDDSLEIPEDFSTSVWGNTEAKPVYSRKEKIMRITSIVLSIMLAASVAFAGNGWQSAYDVRWNITITDSCNGSAVTYHNCYLTNQGQYQISFIPNQGRTGITTGKVITVYASSGCVSYIMEEAD